MRPIQKKESVKFSPPICSTGGTCFIQAEIGTGVWICRDCDKVVVTVENWCVSFKDWFATEIQWVLNNAGKPSVDGRWDWNV